MARQKWSAEEKMNIVLESLASVVNITEVCRIKYSSVPNYKWRESSLQGGLTALASTKSYSREKELEQELEEAKKLSKGIIYIRKIIITR